MKCRLLYGYWPNYYRYWGIERVEKQIIAFALNLWGHTVGSWCTVCWGSVWYKVVVWVNTYISHRSTSASHYVHAVPSHGTPLLCRCCHPVQTSNGGARPAVATLEQHMYKLSAFSCHEKYPIRTLVYNVNRVYTPSSYSAHQTLWPVATTRVRTIAGQCDDIKRSSG